VKFCRRPAASPNSDSKTRVPIPQKQFCNGRPQLCESTRARTLTISPVHHPQPAEQLSVKHDDKASGRLCTYLRSLFDALDSNPGVGLHGHGNASAIVLHLLSHICQNATPFFTQKRRGTKCRDSLTRVLSDHLCVCRRFFTQKFK